MSEEQIQQVENKEHNCCKKLLVLVIVSLLLSIASLGTSIFNMVNDGAQGGKKVVISKQYDKGKSLEKAQETKKPVIVFFYTDWCGFCQRFAPTYHKFSKDKDIKKNFAIAYVNCEKPENSKKMEEFDIHAFPTVYVVDKEGKKTQLENQTFFGEDAVNVMKENALKLIGENK